jgi:predicted ABC-type transport system involved in lysophospholipase L1 biosynthesis ATPase subunit
MPSRCHLPLAASWATTGCCPLFWTQIRILEFDAKSTRSDKAEIARSLDMVLTRFPRLKERYSQTAGTMSGGEQQMMVIGRGLMAKPKLLLPDKPSLACPLAGAGHRTLD